MTTDTLEATPIGDETLAAKPEWQEYFTIREQLDALAAPPDVVVRSGIRAAFDQELDNLARGQSADQALVIGHYVPEPEADSEPEVIEGEIVPDEPLLAEIQQDATAALARWAPKTDTGSLRAVRDDDLEDHHEKTVTLRVVQDSGEAS